MVKGACGEPLATVIGSVGFSLGHSLGNRRVSLGNYNWSCSYRSSFSGSLRELRSGSGSDISVFCRLCRVFLGELRSNSGLDVSVFYRLRWRFLRQLRSDSGLDTSVFYRARAGQRLCHVSMRVDLYCPELAVRSRT
jgi:hypothetical protein